MFGNNIEDSMGPGRFLVFYLALRPGRRPATHVLMQPASPVPTVGASGAISGVLGAYLVLYPKVRVNMLFIFVIFFKVIRDPGVARADLVVRRAGARGATLSPLRPEVSGGVAVWAHIGGFVAGDAADQGVRGPATRRAAERDPRAATAG